RRASARTRPGTGVPSPGTAGAAPARTSAPQSDPPWVLPDRPGRNGQWHNLTTNAATAPQCDRSVDLGRVEASRRTHDATCLAPVRPGVRGRRAPGTAARLPGRFADVDLRDHRDAAGARNHRGCAGFRPLPAAGGRPG